MKYIRKIFEKKAIYISDEFQSCLDIISSSDVFGFESGDDWVKFTYKSYSDQSLSIEEFTKQYSERKTLNDLYDDIIHVCTRLKSDGYNLDILVKTNYIKVNIDLEDNKSFISIDPEDDYISIDKSKLNRFLRKIGINCNEIQLDERTVRSAKGNEQSFFELSMSVVEEPTAEQCDKIIGEIDKLDPKDEEGYKLGIFDEAYYDEERMEIIVEFKKDWWIALD